MDHPRKILRPTDVYALTGYGRTQTYRKSRDPDDDFPAPVQLGANAIGWFEDEISAWLNTRPRVRYAPEPKADDAAPHQSEANAA